MQILYWLVFFRKGVQGASLRKKECKVSVSVIICVKNEANNLRKHLPNILSQDYPSFEVVVVDDHSTDDTRQTLAVLAQANPHLQIVEMSDYEAYIGKKMALTQGIKAAKYDWLLMTDADCTPVSSHWIQEMMVIADKNKKIGLGYSPYTYYKGLLNAFIRYETLLTGIQYSSHARARRPYMGVGRNLIYQKELFLKAGGFERHAHIASGDDDLFISEVATGGNTMVVDSPDSVVFSEPQRTWRAWLYQKKRHLSTGTYYNFLTKALLGFYALTHFIHVFSCILLLSLDFGTVVATLGCVLRILIIVLMCTRFRKKFREVNDWYWIPFLDFLYPFYYMVLTPYLISTTTTTQQQQQSWKQQQHHE